MSPKIPQWISMAVFLTPVLLAGDLSRYRDFQLGMDLSVVEKKAEIRTSETKTIHQRPAVMQDLEWRARDFPAYSGESDPVKGVLLSFYSGHLFRIVANYDRYKTEGMTDEDMVAGISATYGLATKPAAEILFPSSYSETVNVIARWEDAEYSLNLVRSPYQPSFALILLSKQLSSLADTAAVEAIRLDEQEAPQREVERARKQADALNAKEEKARAVNKASFRP